MVVKELVLLCLIATLAALVAVARDETFFAAYFATASGFALTCRGAGRSLALQAGDKR